VTMLLAEEEDVEAITALGRRYDTGSSRLSGSSITSDHNTLINAYVMYCAHRNAGLDSMQAWDSLCRYVLVHGDDGVVSCELKLKNVLQKTVDDLGLAADIVVRYPGSAVTYLGRDWPGLPYGCTDSIGSPVRVLSAIHLTTAPQEVSRGQACLNKALAWLVTDAKTPVVSDWCRAIVQTCKHFGLTEAKLMTREESYRYESGAYLQGNEDEIFAQFVEIVGSTPADVQTAVDAYAGHVNDVIAGKYSNLDWALDAFPDAPLFVPPGTDAPGSYFVHDDGTSWMQFSSRDSPPRLGNSTGAQSNTRKLVKRENAPKTPRTTNRQCSSHPDDSQPTAQESSKRGSRRNRQRDGVPRDASHPGRDHRHGQTRAVDRSLPARAEQGGRKGPPQVVRSNDDPGSASATVPSNASGRTHKDRMGAHVASSQRDGSSGVPDGQRGRVDRRHRRRSRSRSSTRSAGPPAHAHRESAAAAGQREAAWDL
jgi:hypothetical protein